MTIIELLMPLMVVTGVAIPIIGRGVDERIKRGLRIVTWLELPSAMDF